MIVKKSDGTYIGRIDIAPNPVDTGTNYVTHLDYRAKESSCTVSYSTSTKVTTIVMPFPKETTLQVVTRTAGSTSGGTIIPILSEAMGSPTITIDGDQTSTKFYVGEVYEFRYEFSTQYVKESGGTSNSSIKEGRLQLRNMTVAYDKTGFFKTEVTPYRRAVSNDTFTAPIGTAVAGQVNLDNGNFRFSIQSQNEKVTIALVNDSYLPSTFINAEWEGWWHQRGRSI